jgi:ABC-type sugar transport system permease subunit
MSLEAYQTFTANNILGAGAAMAIITFFIVMIVSFLYIRFVGGNIRGLADET